MRNFKRSDQSDRSVRPMIRIRKVHNQDSSLLLTKDDRDQCTFDEWVNKYGERNGKDSMQVLYQPSCW